MAPIYTLQHIEIETLGIIANCLTKTGHHPVYVRLFDGQPVPKDIDESAGLILMGGPMGVYDVNRYPFLSEEIHLIEKAIKANKPVLGICLGSQLIASALGTKVKKGDKKEIGWYDVFLSSSAYDDDLFDNLPSSFKAFHWHGDVFALPAGSARLAYSNLTQCQAFRYGKNVYGILFHMEVESEIINRLITSFKEELRKEGLDEEIIDQGLKAYLPRLQTIGKDVFTQWAKLIETESKG